MIEEFGNILPSYSNVFAVNRKILIDDLYQFILL